MLYQIVEKKEYQTPYAIGVGASLTETFSGAYDSRYAYKIRLRGEVGIPYLNRTEHTYPIYFRKLDDSLISDGTEYFLNFNKINECYERSAYCMCRGAFKVGKAYRFALRYKAADVKENLSVSLEVYYGGQKTRYYYETADEKHSFALKDAKEFCELEKEIVFQKEVDFVMVKISGVDFKGTASVYTPILTDGETNFVPKFSYIPDELGTQEWIGEGFSLTERPIFTVKVNGIEVFKGHKLDRLHRFAGVEFVLPNGILADENKVEICFDKANRYPYIVKEIQWIALPKEFEIVGVSSLQVKDRPFGVLCYTGDAEKIEVENSSVLSYQGCEDIGEGYKVVKFLPKTTSGQLVCGIVADGVRREFTLDSVVENSENEVLTGSGDFIYVHHDFSDFIEYLSWYLNKNVGNMLTVRCCYRWGMTAEYNEEFWKRAVKALCAVGLKYALMIDGRELNGVNANPTLEVMKSKYFLGEQTHERDGAFTYWTQQFSEHEMLFYHLLSAKLQRNGIYGKLSPVYDKNGEAYLFYTGQEIHNVKEAYEELVRNLKNTGADGATRHTGVTPLFSAFFDAGYKWLGYESMYGPHELILGAIRGMSRAIGQKSFGTHLALQWSTVPCDDYAHALRYKLSLYLSYMHGVTEVNTEEGLWNIENPFTGFDRFSKACVSHREEQSEFYKFVLNHKRTGTFSTKIAMMVGLYDGMDCFSTGKVYGQHGEEWKYAAPEKSWDLLKVFYPQADINSIYYYIKKNGRANLDEEEKTFLDEFDFLYRDVTDYKSLGFYSATPYGVIDLISAKAENLNDYEFIFFTGWNSCTEEQVKRLCAYMENGGTLLMAKPHLYDSLSRKEVLFGKAEILSSEWTEKLLSYREKGRLIYFDTDAYPIEIEGYEKTLKELAKKYSSGYITQTENVSFSEYEQSTGERTIYLLNIDWWDEKPATCKLCLGKEEYPIELRGNKACTLRISASGAVAALTDSVALDIAQVSENSAVIKGFGSGEITVYANGQARTQSVCVNGETIITF